MGGNNPHSIDEVKKMNFVYLKGIIKNIQYSHTIDDIVFNRAELIVKKPDGRESLLIIKFKQFTTEVKENSEIELIGNIRSYSRMDDGKHKVEIYIFTYFDEVEITTDDLTNIVKLDGKICKKDNLRTTYNGKHYIHFIVANNLEVDGAQRLNSYIPCVAWGKLAKYINEHLNVSDTVYLEGQAQSREYKKKSPDGLELGIAHEVLVTTINEVSDEL